MILAGTGHRLNKLGGFNDTRAYKNTLWLARNALERLEPDRAISGMALGWDQAVALAALDLGIPLTAAIPFPGQESRWPAQAVALYRAILERASTVIYVSQGAYSPEKMQVRNEWMVDQASLVLALFNGSKGGTRNTILYAQKLGRQIENLWPQWKDLDELV